MDCGFCKQQEIQSCLIRRPLHHFMAYVYIYCDVEYIYKLFCLLSASALHNVRDQFLCTQPNDYVFVVNGTYDKHTLVEQRNNIVYFAFMPGNVYWNAKGRQDHIRLSLSLCVQCAPFMNSGQMWRMDFDAVHRPHTGCLYARRIMWPHITSFYMSSACVYFIFVFVCGRPTLCTIPENYNNGRNAGDVAILVQQLHTKEMRILWYVEFVSDLISLNSNNFGNTI